ncbi:MAG: hypothetical protein KBS74_04040 [Clostridiales bacterium]|nr:hypothetical protein [Candidatus Cacconaster stercorequi]
MAKLTSERVNGIKTGYWSLAKKDELIQRLGQIEYRSEKLISQICDSLCRMPRGDVPADQLEEFCEHCPATILAKMIDGEYPSNI